MADKDIYKEAAEAVYHTREYHTREQEAATAASQAAAYGAPSNHTQRPTIAQLTKRTDEALRAEEQRAKPDQQRWERNACAMNLVLLSMQQAGREWFTDHDARVIENITEMTERHILGIAPRRMVAGAGKTFAPRDKLLDAVDKAVNEARE